MHHVSPDAICGSCGQSGHLRRSHRDCLHNPQRFERLTDEQLTNANLAQSKNREDPRARSHLYPNFPENYVYDQRTRTWKDHQRGFGKTIGRIYAVSPREVEKFHLRLLLYHVPGAQSFQDLRTVDGAVLPSFQAAARRRGLLNDDGEWEHCLREAVSYQAPFSLRQLFAIILCFCEPAQPFQLWLQFRNDLTEDILRSRRIQLEDMTLAFSDGIYNAGLLEIEDHLSSLSRSLTDFEGFVLPETNSDDAEMQIDGGFYQPGQP